MSFTPGNDWRPLVVVTGATGGIGYACAHAFHRRGARLVIADIDRPAMRKVAAELDAESSFCDAASQASIADFAAKIVEQGAIPDILINAAGEGYIRTLGMVWVSRELMPTMRFAGGPRLIINIAPTRNHQPASGQFPYAASPLAFRCLSESLAQQSIGSATQVMTVIPPNPGVVEQPAASVFAAQHALVIKTDDANRIAAMAQQMLGLMRQARAG